jgi:hypothetical protein
MTGKGIITEIIDWITHPYYSEETFTFWAVGLIVILAVSFLWSEIPRKLVE